MKQVGIEAVKNFKRRVLMWILVPMSLANVGKTINGVVYHLHISRKNYDHVKCMDGRKVLKDFQKEDCKYDDDEPMK